MYFLTLIKKRNKFYFKLATLPIVFLLVALMVFLWPKNSQMPIKHYLPLDSVFYLHIKQANWQPISINFIPKEVVVDLWQGQKNLWGPYYINIEELLWFKRENNVDKDGFLLRFSTLPDKKYLESLADSHPELNIYRLDKNIILASPFSKDNINFYQQSLPAEEPYLLSEATLYLQEGFLPAFLADFHSFVEQIFGQGAIFLSVSNRDRQMNILSLEKDKNGTLANFSALTLPKNLDFGIGVSSDISSQNRKVVLQSFVANNFDALPYNAMGLDYWSGALLENKAIFQEGDKWLLASFGDFGQESLQFLRLVKVKEVQKTLIDGTRYYELVAQEDQLGQEYDFHGQKYKQIGDLYAFEANNYNYLSNSRDMIETLISQPVKIGGILKCGNLNSLKIEDFILADVDKLSDPLLKEYLLNNKITNLRVFSYKIGDFKGINICY